MLFQAADRFSIDGEKTKQSSISKEKLQRNLGVGRMSQLA